MDRFNRRPDLQVEQPQNGYVLSVVLLIPAAHQAEINAIAEAAGYGPDNLTCPLIHTDGSTWFGGHTWAAPAFLTDIGSAPPSPALAALVMSVREGGEPLEHWNNVLLENSLTRKPEEM